MERIISKLENIPSNTSLFKAIELPLEAWLVLAQVFLDSIKFKQKLFSRVDNLINVNCLTTISLSYEDL
jgi:hypothetical protein